jgi:predicted RND superfamily exporter protein
MAALTAGITLIYTLHNLSIRTDPGKMLSEDLPFRKSWREYKRAFPQYLNTILLVIDAETPDLAHDASKALVDRLKSNADLFKTVYPPGGGRPF